ncbi:MAG: aspartate/glutamate racemase family protein [Victivallaceae bacterium]|nr:aspartate/glutamate racemase family protein [Victivallaceae bacterium]
MQTKALQDKIKIITTDSGLGGLAIGAMLAERLKSGGYFREIELVFFNCCPAAERGYQHLATNAQRSLVFSRALDAITAQYAPDAIVIACNTLSAVYPETEFARSGSVPVIGIIEPGIEEIRAAFRKHPELHLVMFATPATVSAGIHRKILTESGFPPEQLLYQECPGLPRAIDYGDQAEITGKIETFTAAAVNRLNGKKFGIALFCTHFGYVREYFAQAARRYAGFSGEIVHPDSALVDLVLSRCRSGRFSSGSLSIKVVSQAGHSEQMKNSVIPFLATRWPETVQALQNDIHLPGLFDFNV